MMQSMRDMPNLDVLRSVAVISVVVEHVLLALGVTHIGWLQVAWVGVYGVFVFFVLTSLVLMWSLDRKPHTLDFYIRRFFRIYPLALVCIAAAVLTHAPTSGSPTDFFAYAPQHLHGFLQNATLLMEPTHWTIGVLWSLPYEVKMYLLLPVLYFFVRRNFSLWPMLVLWALAVMNANLGSPQSHNFAVAIAYFLPGVMAYIGFGRWKPVLPGWALMVFLAAVWAACLIKPNFHWSAWIFCLIVGLALPLFRQIRSKAVVGISKQIAKYSYGVYLTHLFALVIGLYLMRGHSLGVRLLLMVVPLVALPVLAYHLMERPMIQLGSKLAAIAEARYEQHEAKLMLRNVV